MDKFNSPKADDSWDLVLKPKTGLFDINFGELIQSADLISLFVRRDFVTFYKQMVEILNYRHDNGIVID